MKILVVNSARGLGGGITSAVELAGGLAGRGHEVTVVCHPASPIRAALERDGRVRLRPIAIRAELNPVRVAQLARTLRDVAPDAVLADRRKDVKLTHAASRLRPPATRPARVHRHGAPSTLRDSTLYRHVWSRLHGLIVNSDAMRQRLLHETPWLEAVPIAVIPNGKDIATYRPRPELRAAMRAELGIPADAFVAVYHGALIARKNVDILVRAVGAGADVWALIVGRGVEEARLRALAEQTGARVRFAGARDDVPAVLAAADVAVHLSSAEGFANSVVEAMACGLPVLASRAASHPEQVDDGESGFLLPPGEPDALRQAITTLVTSPELLARMATAARERAAERFDIATMLARYEAALAAAVERARRPAN